MRRRVPKKHRPYSHGQLAVPSSSQWSWREHKGRYVELTSVEGQSFGAQLARMTHRVRWEKVKLW